jgi:hypothetical protein
MNEVPKLLIFRQKTAKKGQMENGLENYNLSIIPAMP